MRTNDCRFCRKSGDARRAKLRHKQIRAINRGTIRILLERRSRMKLTADNLTCIRGGRVIFTGLHFALPAGQALAIMGRNGAGKSSLLRIIAGLLPLASGALALEGDDADFSLAEQCHYLGHRDALKPALSVMENLRFWHDFLGGEQRDPQAALHATGIGHLADLPAAYLSAGQKRRLSIARLLCAQRPIWLLDEPTSALDVSAQSMLAGLMQAHLDSGGLILAATHAPLGLARIKQLAMDRFAPASAAFIEGVA